MANAHDNLKLRFGLIGRGISYSFSQSFFNAKFVKQGLQHRYENFDIDSIDQFEDILNSTTNLRGLNVTIPYKEAIIPFLDDLDTEAKKIGAVNTILITRYHKCIGYNTDYYGFKKSLQPHLQSHHRRALILGTGGASKAIAYALDSLNIDFDYVSRTIKTDVKFQYDDLTEDIISSYNIIINCTPLGTYPDVNECPPIPYDAVSKRHILYDLIYNPEQTKFLSCGDLQGAITINGLEMLKLQAEKAWDIWMTV
jgi:shikimate dehydrogenase